ncbi:carbohydrate binding domain-containing protein [Microbulbifer bruguierae]|uniref:Carbohydrate binding domain-containing protein n=1 Tax=Microbulbifer bruguierae TaxID=3029061 RepID=A0ABY8NCK0_9GAMM|nr:carbohydrate binding domain-containing protein [Microbulbifer bruguierae]WGL16175.1 carbohydrate binding domain-containing protein [Microbulbifer bruguierae]
MKRCKNKIAMKFGCAAALSVCMASANASIQNPGFESDWDSWEDTDPSAISSVAQSGGKSAKISGSGGRVEQQVSVSANTNYRLSAYVLGAGTVGVEVGSSTIDTSADSSDWQKLAVEFNSGSAISVTVFGAYNGDEGRLDTLPSKTWARAPAVPVVPAVAQAVASALPAAILPLHPRRTAAATMATTRVTPSTAACLRSPAGPPRVSSGSRSISAVCSV